MRDNIIAKRNTINLIFTLIGLGLLIYTIYQGVHDYKEEQHAVKVDAEITAFTPGTFVNTGNIKYLVEGEVYEISNVNLGIDKTLTVGDTTKIKYDINNPKRIVYNDHLILLSITGVLSVIILLLTLPRRIKLINRSMKIATLKKEGNQIEATIQDIIVNNKAKQAKGYYPYHLRARYLDPNTNNNYLFESEDTYININDQINKYQAQTIKVYVDKANIMNYFVDLSSIVPDYKVTNPREYMQQFYAQPHMLEDIKKAQAAQKAAKGLIEEEPEEKPKEEEPNA